MARGPNLDTRRKILDIALRLFTTQGYDRTSLREISQCLGFSKAALYYHFHAKEDIVEALAGDLLDQFEQIVRVAAAVPERSLATRTATLSEIIDLLLSHRATAELLLSAPLPQHTDLGERMRFLMPLAQQALMPAAHTISDRVCASAALSIVRSALDHLADVPVPTLREILLDLAVTTLCRADNLHHGGQSECQDNGDGNDEDRAQHSSSALIGSLAECPGGQPNIRQRDEPGDKPSGDKPAAKASVAGQSDPRS